ncbi:MAG: SRPBCC family protein [Salinibacterium sp.]|nr:SRPBCC family protein [Salinibacterium sp.]
MVRSQSSVEVDHSAEEVFAFLADASNNPKWRSGGFEIRHIGGRGVGAEYEQQFAGPGGRMMRANYRVSVWEEPTRLEFEVTAGPARPHGTFTIHAISPASCRVTFTITLELQGVMKLVRGLIEEQVAAETATIHNLPRAMRGL